MQRGSPTGGVDLGADERPAGPFVAEAIVLITLNSPREKFWGAILDLAPAGLSVRGIDLNSFEDFAGLVKAGELVTPAAVFFPMHRIERIEIDSRAGDIPSLRERFQAKTGQDFARLIGPATQPFIPVGSTLAEAQRRLVEATLASVEQDLGRAARILDLPEDELKRWLERSRGAAGPSRQGA